MRSSTHEQQDTISGDLCKSKPPHHGDLNQENNGDINYDPTLGGRKHSAIASYSSLTHWWPPAGWGHVCVSVLAAALVAAALFLLDSCNASWRYENQWTSFTITVYNEHSSSTVKSLYQIPIKFSLSLSPYRLRLRALADRLHASTVQRDDHESAPTATSWAWETIGNSTEKS